MIAMSSLNIIEAARLAHIPARFHAHHEFCFHLHDVMVTVLQEAEKYKISTVTFQFIDSQDAAAFEQSDDPIAYLTEIGRRDVAARVTLNQVSLALYADLLHFVLCTRGLEGT